jgi:5-methylcytosine-specific restriction endonuclease McrA
MEDQTMRLCSGAGCGRKVADNVRYCAECQPVRANDDGQRVHVRPGIYGQALDRLLKGGRWQRVRDIAIKRCPLCARCNAAVSEIVDHIIPADVAIQQARDSGRYPCDPDAGYYLMSNLQGLCRSCHARKTAEDKAHVGPWPDVLEAEAKAPKKVWSF